MAKQADDMSKLAMQGNEIPMDHGDEAAPEPSSSPENIGPNSSKNQFADSAPPPYVETVSTSLKASPGHEKHSSDGSKRSRPLSRSFKALTSGLRPKPEPLVCALCEAATRDDVGQIKGLLAQGANIKGSNEDGHTPLYCAIVANNVDSTRILLESGADPKKSGSRWSSIPPLFLAASVGSIDVAKEFLRYNDNLNAKTITGQPYFADVVAKQNIEGVRFLIENGADANTTDISGHPVLVTAVKLSNVGLARLLLEKGASLETKDSSGSALLTLAASKENPDIEMIELLLTHGASPNAIGMTGSPILAEAVSKKWPNFAKMLLNIGANGDVKDLTGQPVLIHVIMDMQLNDELKLELVRLLLRNGASSNAVDKTRNIPALSHALELDNTDLVRALLEHGAKTMPAMSSRHPPLLHAIDRDNLDQTNLLLAYGADPKQADKNGRTAFMAAETRGPALKQLLSQYRETNVENRGLWAFA